MGQALSLRDTIKLPETKHSPGLHPKPAVSLSPHRKREIEESAPSYYLSMAVPLPLIFSIVISVIVMLVHFRTVELTRALEAMRIQSDEQKQQLDGALAALRGLSEITKSQTNILTKSLHPSEEESPPTVDGNPDSLKVVQVTAPKANLRVGPSKNDGLLMAVSEGTRLVVELSKDNWYRVVAPSGERAWISADVVEEESVQWK